MAYTGQPWASHKEARICIAPQENLGTPATTGFVEVPTKSDCDIDVSPDYRFFQMGGGFRGKTWYGDGGDTIEGSFVLPLSPGYVGDGVIYDWLWGRGDAAGFYQGGYATVIKVINLGLSNEWVELYQDVKVASGSITLDRGTDYLEAECSLKGMYLPDVAAEWPVSVDQTFVDGSLYPYKFSEASFTVGGSGVLVTKNHVLSFDNMLEDVDSLAGSTTLYDAPNQEWTDWTVSYDQWYVSSVVRAAFLAGTEGSYVATLTRGGSVATFTMPRIKYTAAPLKVGTGGLIKQEGINFQALVSLSGDETTMACTVAEAVSS